MSPRTVLQRINPHLGEVVRGSGLSFVARTVGGGLGILLSVLLARILGADGFGVYSLTLTCLTFGSVIGRLGVDNAVLRFTAAAVAAGDWAQAAAVRRNGLAITFSGSLSISVALILLAPVLATEVFHEPALETPLTIIALAVVPLSLLSLNGELLKAVKRVGQGTLIQVAMTPALQLGPVAILFILGSGWTVDDMVMLHLIALVAVALISFVLWKRSWLARGPALTASPALKKLISTSFPLLWVTLIGMTLTLADILMLGIWETSETVGYYAAAARTAGILTMILAAFNSVTAPKFSELHSQGLSRELALIARGSTLMMTAAALTPMLLVIFAAELIMRFYGQGFVQGASALTILTVGQFINVACGSVGLLLIMTGHEKTIRNIMVVAGTLNIFLNAILIPQFGAVGAACATTTSVVAINLFSVVIVYRKLSINMIALAETEVLRRAFGVIFDVFEKK